MGSCGNGEDKGVARGAREKDREIEKGGFFGGRDGRPRMSEGKEGKSSFSLSLSSARRGGQGTGGGKEGAEEIDVCGRAARYSPSKIPSSTRSQASHREVKVRKVNPVTRRVLPRARAFRVSKTETTRILQDPTGQRPHHQGLQVDS